MPTQRSRMMLVAPHLVEQFWPKSGQTWPSSADIEFGRHHLVDSLPISGSLPARPTVHPRAPPAQPAPPGPPAPASPAADSGVWMYHISRGLCTSFFPKGKHNIPRITVSGAEASREWHSEARHALGTDVRLNPRSGTPLRKVQRQRKKMITEATPSQQPDAIRLFVVFEFDDVPNALDARRGAFGQASLQRILVMPTRWGTSCATLPTSRSRPRAMQLSGMQADFCPTRANFSRNRQRWTETGGVRLNSGQLRPNSVQIRRNSVSSARNQPYLFSPSTTDSEHVSSGIHQAWPEFDRIWLEQYWPREDEIWRTLGREMPEVGQLRPTRWTPEKRFGDTPANRDQRRGPISTKFGPMSAECEERNDVIVTEHAD